MKKSPLLGAICTCLIFVSQNNNAATLTYTEKTAFTSAAGSLRIEDFNALVNGSAFHTTPLDVGAFTLSMTGTPLTTRNFIDAPPPDYVYFDFSVDGTTFAFIHIDSDDSLFVTFDSPITAFGVDLRELNSDSLSTEIIAAEITITPAIKGEENLRFIGIISDTPYSTVEFRGLTIGGFGMDNVMFSGTAIPIPTAIWLFSTGLLGLIGIARRKQAT